MAKKECTGCGEVKAPASVPYVVHESAMARAERNFKRLWIVIIVLISLLVASNVAWLVYESQFEVVETITEEYDIEQNADGGNNNSIINGGGVTNGVPTN